MISDRSTKSHKIPQIPLRLVLIVPFVLQIVGAVGIVGYSSYRNGQEAVNSMADRMMEQTTKRVRDHLDNTLQIQQQAVATPFPLKE